MTSSGKRILLSIRCSHYVERARWALELAGLAYEEQSSPPCLHLLSVLAVRPKGCSRHSVPVLITPDAGVLTDSLDIVAYAASHSDSARSLYPDDPALRAEVDAIELLCAKTVGVWGRVVVYDAIFHDSAATIKTLCEGVPAWKAALFRVFYWPIKGLMIQGMQITPANAAKCKSKIRDLFAELGQKLEGGRKKYFVGGSFTAADLTFASLAAIVLLPDEHYGGRPGMVDLSGPRRLMDPELLQELRGTVAGKHALEMYRSHRMPGGGEPKQGMAGSLGLGEQGAAKL